LFGCAPLPDLLPQPLEWQLFARKRFLRGVVEPGGYKIFRLKTPRSLPGQAAEDEATRVQVCLAKVENQLDRFRAEEFWDRVMRETANLLAERGAMTPTEILPELRGVTIRGATLHKEPLTPGTLKKKMDVRVSFVRNFVAQRDGRYGWRSA
jgi:hypothetical protein